MDTNMNNKKLHNKHKAFTLSEILVVICVIGVLTVLTLVSMGNKVDKNKALFKKAYSLTERITVELVNDEMYYPYDFNNFGFKETSNAKILGTDEYICGDSGTLECGKLEKFCKLFSNSLNTQTVTDTCHFTTNDNIEWIIAENTTSGFLVTIDTNGMANESGKYPNKPAAIDNIAADGKVDSRDRFFILVRNDGKISLPDDDDLAKEYLRSSNLNKKHCVVVNGEEKCE